MSLKHFTFLCFVFLLTATCLPAQRLGLLPANTKWRELRHDSLRVIFPEGQEAVAKRVASLMLKVSRLDPISPDGRYHRISVLLQPHTNISNGYVGLAPYVSEFYLQANENPFALGSLPWHELLAVHEYRHVQQLNAANTGFSHIAKVLFGDLAFTGLYNLAIPDWYREGDAVLAETKWTSQGRGRLSSFTLPFYQKLMEGDAWEYYKVRNGSYKEFTPDHYPLGYLLIQYGNHLFGESTWDSIVIEAARYEHLFSPFSGAVKSRTGYRNKELYEAAMKWYQEKWHAEKTEDVSFEMIPITKHNQDLPFYDMTFPDVDGDGTIMTSISTFDHTTAIYKIHPEGKQKKVVSLGVQQDTYFDHSNHRYVWTELRFDPRWLRKDRNVIVVYDEATSMKRTIWPEKGYFTPSLDQRGVRIAALHEDEAGQYNLHIVDGRSGAVLHRLPNPQNLYLGYPVFSEDEKEIISVARDDKGRMALVRQDIASGEISNITHYSYYILGKPVVQGHWIFLTTNIDRLDQVYAVDRQEGIFYKVSYGNMAHYDPAWDPLQDQLVCSQYRTNGKKLVRLSGQPKDWKLANLGDGVKSIPGDTGIDLLAMDLDENAFDISKFSPWSNAINPHSLFVVADDPLWAAEVRSDNIMNTVSIAAGYQYNRNSQAKGPYIDLRLGMWYPVITLGLSQTSREITADDGREFRVSNERINAGLSLPLYYSSGVYQQNVILASTYTLGMSEVRPRVPDLEDFSFDYITHRMIVINSRRRAYRQPLPTWGQRLDIAYSHEVTGVNVSQLYLAGDLALPAIRPSHYTLLHGEFLSQDLREGSIQLGSNYAGARGFPQMDGKTQYRGGITYGLPIAYPDIGIGNIFYTKRIRLQPFYDMAFVNFGEEEKWLRSAGAELLVDFEFPPITVGLRYSRLLEGHETSPNQFEIFLPLEKF